MERDLKRHLLLEKMNEVSRFLPRRELRERVHWLIYLRWIASVGLLIVITVSEFVFDIELALVFLYPGAAALPIYNTVFLFYFKRIDTNTDADAWFRKVNLLVNVQICLDLILLLYLIHFSGGLENPFIFFFIFHMVIAGILLSRRAAYTQASLIVILFFLVMGAEALGLLKHYHIGEWSSCTGNMLFFLVKSCTFAGTLFVTAYMATAIIQKLREQESDLQKANKRLEEQDRIKSQYVSGISHDIKGSLGAIQSCLKVVLNGLTGSLSDGSKVNGSAS